MKVINSTNYSLADSADVLFHYPCMDGFCASWVFSVYMQPQYKHTKYFAANYGNPLPEEIFDRSNLDLYILDFSIPPYELALLATRYKNIFFLDHHKTAFENYADWKPIENVHIALENEHSGAGLAYKYFSHETIHGNVKTIVDYVEDRDLWKFKIPGTKEFHEWLSTIDQTFEAWTEEAGHLDTRKSIEIGATLLKRHQKICADIALTARKLTIHTDQFGPIEGLIATASGHFASDVGHLLAKKSGTFGATTSTNSEGNNKISLRSIGDFDVSAIAKEFGGGGPKNAAGFVLPGEPIATIFHKEDV